MRCPGCDFENAAGKKFCIRCGVAFGVRCAKCGSENPPEATFCGDCGELNLWSGLRELLDYVSHQNGVRYVNNGQLLKYNSAGQIASGTPANREIASPA